MRDKHKLAYIVGMVLAFTLYMLGTDPDAGFVKNLPFGADLVLVGEKLLLLGIIILFVETVPDYLTDKETGTIKSMTDKIKETNDTVAMSFVIMGRYIKIASYVIGGVLLFS